MYYPAIAEMIEKRFHRTGTMIDINRRGKDQNVGAVHSHSYRLKHFIMRTQRFAFFKTVSTAAAELAEITRKKKFRNIVRQLMSQYISHVICRAFMVLSVYNDDFQLFVRSFILSEIATAYSFIFLKSLPSIITLISGSVPLSLTSILPLSPSSFSYFSIRSVI